MQPKSRLTLVATLMLIPSSQPSPLTLEFFVTLLLLTKSRLTLVATLTLIPSSQTSPLTLDFFVTLLLLTTVVTMPLVIGWAHIAKEMFAFNFMMDMIFGLDILKNFCTGYVEESSGNIIMDRKMIVATYLETWFLIDLVSMLPIGESWSRGWTSENKEANYLQSPNGLHPCPPLHAHQMRR